MSVYDPIAKQYRESRQSEIYNHIELYTYFNKLGDVSGKSILDLGCGEGVYSRKLKESGATKVVGVDISSGMLAEAKAQEAQNSLGIEYILSDMRKLGTIGSFDLACAMFSLNHAKTREDISEMCQTIYDNLKPNGRFLGLNNNVELSPDAYRHLEKYKYHRQHEEGGALKDGVPISSLAYELDGKPYFIDDYYLSQETYESAFKQAGFKQVNWYQPMVSPEGIEKHGEAYWKELLENPPMVLIEALK
ncbi:class I SAM-dependent methyltransferase [Roseofilum casamattae]|uniref:Class I SAM-dependent methyltransferase n=1 Tax=Roseofilum casamattae BLCC-M143 TaxID=3022442 RepID=A0ABT7BV89_9CYAN|nr:class I SAM-dependent methyltransferase [Roseofilum casamattae]MDJ1183105.1 class I SAM-dependent methyltransferase [Roseofilum casamattae BLCC-M143]